VSVVALVLPAAPPAATPPPFARAPITLAQSGKTFRLAKGRAVALRLSGRWAWTEPRRSSSAVELTRVVFIVDPGYSEWQIAANRRGTATIRSVGTPRCHDCGLSVRRFVVTIRVV
jgi:hypothetical protein